MTKKLKKTLLEKLSLNELSLVNAGANQFAAVTIHKSMSADPLAESIAKYFITPNGNAVDFNSLLNESKKWEMLCEAQEELQPLFDALKGAITSNFSDLGLTNSQRQANVDQAINDFLTAVRETMPDLEEELQKFFEDFSKAGSSGNFNPDGEKMSEIEKKLAEIEKALAEKTTELEKAYKDMAEMKAMEEKKKKEAEMKKSDETIEVAGAVISKSAVGEEQFAIFKAQATEIAKMQEKIAKSEEAAEMALLEKQAIEKFAHLPGTALETAKMLKALKSMPEDVAKSFETVLAAADEKNSAAFKTFGKTHAEPAAASAEEKLAKYAQELRKASPNLTEAQALVKAYSANPELYAEVK